MTWLNVWGLLLSTATELGIMVQREPSQYAPFYDHNFRLVDFVAMALVLMAGELIVMT